VKAQLKILKRGGHDRITRIHAVGNKLMITVACTAGKLNSCASKVSAASHGQRTVSKKLTLKGGSTKQIVLHLTGHKSKARKVKVTVRTGSYVASKTVG
jgi:hypothetical protein